MRHAQYQIQPKHSDESFTIPETSPALAQAILRNSAPDVSGLTGEILALTQ
ncbi:hypothetical protein ACFQH1_11515 [Lactiplantibacillus daoliensis]|uniref:Uncharacterized protein n=1 Tax=Lactiplantibacillus daoliensis TaxID=2559916 RepID=A0ABW1UKS2_9LACO